MDLESLFHRLDQIAAAQAIEEGYLPVLPEVVETAKAILDRLSGLGTPEPASVCSAPDGDIILEWGGIPGVARRIVVERGGGGTFWTSYPDGPGRFEAWTFRPFDGTPQGVTKAEE